MHTHTHTHHTCTPAPDGPTLPAVAAIPACIKVSGSRQALNNLLICNTVPQAHMHTPQPEFTCRFGHMGQRSDPTVHFQPLN